MKIETLKCDICGELIHVKEEHIKIKHCHAPNNFSHVPEIHLCGKHLVYIQKFVKEVINNHDG